MREGAKPGSLHRGSVRLDRTQLRVWIVLALRAQLGLPLQGQLVLWVLRAAFFSFSFISLPRIRFQSTVRSTSSEAFGSSTGTNS